MNEFEQEFLEALRDGYFVSADVDHPYAQKLMSGSACRSMKKRRFVGIEQYENGRNYYRLNPSGKRALASLNEPEPPA